MRTLAVGLTVVAVVRATVSGSGTSPSTPRVDESGPTDAGLLPALPLEAEQPNDPQLLSRQLIDGTTTLDRLLDFAFECLRDPLVDEGRFETDGRLVVPLRLDDTRIQAALMVLPSTAELGEQFWIRCETPAEDSGLSQDHFAFTVVSVYFRFQGEEPLECIATALNQVRYSAAVFTRLRGRGDLVVGGTFKLSAEPSERRTVFLRVEEGAARQPRWEMRMSDPLVGAPIGLDVPELALIHQLLRTVKPF